MLEALGNLKVLPVTFRVPCGALEVETNVAYTYFLSTKKLSTITLHNISKNIANFNFYINGKSRSSKR